MVEIFPATAKSGLPTSFMKTVSPVKMQNYFPFSSPTIKHDDSRVCPGVPITLVWDFPTLKREFSDISIMSNLLIYLFELGPIITGTWN